MGSNFLYLNPTQAKLFFNGLPDDNINNAFDKALNQDLRSIGDPKLPPDINSKDCTISGPFIVQLQSIKDIGSPKTKQFVNAHANRMLSLQITDGQTLCRAIEYQKTPQI